MQIRFDIDNSTKISLIEGEKIQILTQYPNNMTMISIST